MKKSEAPNLLDLYPARQCQWVAEGDRVTLEAPRFATRFARWLCRRLRMRPDFLIRFDDYGSRVWRLCDGRRSVGEIAARLSEEFGEDVEPLYERLDKFLRMLEMNELLLLEPRGDEARSQE